MWVGEIPGPPWQGSAVAFQPRPIHPFHLSSRILTVQSDHTHTHTPQQVRGRNPHAYTHIPQQVTGRNLHAYTHTHTHTHPSRSGAGTHRHTHTHTPAGHGQEPTCLHTHTHTHTHTPQEVRGRDPPTCSALRLGWLAWG